ncbi:MAG: hypothetical protein ACE5GO_04695 [Anaerolineales bacterium]
MAEYRCCRFHKWFVLMLALSALSLMSHILTDIAALSIEPGVTYQMQGSPENGQTDTDVRHATSLHGGFLPNKLPVFGFPQTLFSVGETSEPFSLAWILPTLVPPPIVF